MKWLLVTIRGWKVVTRHEAPHEYCFLAHTSEQSARSCRRSRVLTVKIMSWTSVLDLYSRAKYKTPCKSLFDFSLGKPSFKSIKTEKDPEPTDRSIKPSSPPQDALDSSPFSIHPHADGQTDESPQSKDHLWGGSSSYDLVANEFPDAYEFGGNNDGAVEDYAEDGGFAE
jgi:hypothetical protein